MAVTMTTNQLSGSAADTFNRLNSINVVPADKTGFAGLDPNVFIKLLIAQLQNQDPLEPVGNEELLSQLSMMQNLQSNIDMQETLKDLGESLGTTTDSQQEVAELLTSNFAGQRLSTAASLLGNSVTGANSTTGIVDRAFLKDGKVFLGLGNRAVALEQVQSINTIQSLVGSLVTGKAAADESSGSGDVVTGVVENAFVSNGETFVSVRGRNLPLQDVTNVYSTSFLTGKTVTYQSAGSGGANVNTTGKVDSTFEANGRQFVKIGNKDVPLSDIVSVTLS